GSRSLARAPLQGRRRFGHRRGSPDWKPNRYDVVHAHFGLSAWPALAIPARVRALTVHGSDLLRPRTRLATAAVLPLIELIGGVEPDRVPLWVNAANAVVVPSEREGFGLAVLEALACEVPVLATPVGIHAQALAGVEGSLCAPFGIAAWRAALEPHLERAAPT